MLKFTFQLIILLSFSIFASAQNIIDTSGKDLQKLAIQIQEDSNFENRYLADSLFTRRLIATLKTPYSFNFTFDSLLSIRQIVSPDKKFKLFTWQLSLEDGTFLQRGAMQMNTSDGQLKLLPFFDKSEKFDAPEAEICNRKKWMGAIYYDIILTEYNNIPYYTLLGYDEYNNFASRKIIEVIHFEKEEPIIGGDFFIYPPDDTYPVAPIQRFIYHYKKGSNAYIKYDKETRFILLSELSSTSNDLKMKSTLVPTGNEIYFEWRNGKWIMPSK